MTQVKDEHFSGIGFDWVRVRELHFVDNPESIETETLTDLQLSVTVEAKVGKDADWCRTLLRVKVTPPESQPEAFLSLVAVIEGSFSVHGEAVVDLGTFARRQAPAILMPFVREAVSRLTAGSRIGQVLLPPINVAALTEEMERSSSPGVEG